MVMPVANCCTPLVAGGVMDSMLNVRLKARGFDPRPFRFSIATFVVHTPCNNNNNNNNDRLTAFDPGQPG